MFECVPVDVEEAVRLYEGGMTLMEVGERLGCSWMTVQRRLKVAGVEIRNVGSRGKCGKRNNTEESEPTRHIAYAAKMREMAIERLNANPCIELLEYGNPSRVRCSKCGTEYKWTRDSPRLKEPCPNCRKLGQDAERLIRERKKYEYEQQGIAAREWRASVPRICKECGEPFYSEHENASYCSDRCRNRVRNRRTAERKARKGSAQGYRRRMRIERTPTTYDSTVTLGAVYKKYHGKCCQCGCMTRRTKGYAPNQATLDHIVALANNGTHTWDNVQLLCSNCNSMKRDVGQMRLPIAI